MNMSMISAGCSGTSNWSSRTADLHEHQEHVFSVVFAIASIAFVLIALLHVACLAAAHPYRGSSENWSFSKRVSCRQRKRKIAPALGSSDQLQNRLVAIAQFDTAAAFEFAKGFSHQYTAPPSTPSSRNAAGEVFIRASVVAVPMLAVFQGIPLLFSVWAIPSSVHVWWKHTVAWISSLLAPIEEFSMLGAVIFQSVVIAGLFFLLLQWQLEREVTLFTHRLHLFSVSLRMARQYARMLAEEGCCAGKIITGNESIGSCAPVLLKAIGDAIVLSSRPAEDLPDILGAAFSSSLTPTSTAAAFDACCSAIRHRLARHVGLAGHVPLDDCVKLTLLCFFARTGRTAWHKNSDSSPLQRSRSCELSDTQLDWVARRICLGEDDVADALEMIVPTSAPLLSRHDRCLLRSMFDELKETLSCASSCSSTANEQGTLSDEDLFTFRVGSGDHHVFAMPLSAMQRKENAAAVAISADDVYDITLISSPGDVVISIAAPLQHCRLAHGEVARVMPILDNLVQQDVLTAPGGGRRRHISSLRVEPISTDPTGGEPKDDDGSPKTAIALHNCLFWVQGSELILEADDDNSSACRRHCTFAVRMEYRGISAGECPVHRLCLQSASSCALSRLACCHKSSHAFRFCIARTVDDLDLASSQPPSSSGSSAVSPLSTLASSSPEASQRPGPSSSSMAPRQLGSCHPHELLVCPGTASTPCSYALCSSCFARHGGGRWVSRIRMSLLFRLGQLTSVQGLHSIVLLATQFVLFPFTQTAASVAHCYMYGGGALDATESPFGNVSSLTNSSLALSRGSEGVGRGDTCTVTALVLTMVILVVCRFGVALVWTLELRRRKRMLAPLLLLSPSSSPDHLWAKFLQVDNTAWSSMYRSHEFAYMDWEPGFQLSFQLALCAASSLLPDRSLSQRAATAAVEGTRFLTLSLTNFFIDPWMDALAKTSSAHQLVQMACSQWFSPQTTQSFTLPLDNCSAASPIDGSTATAANAFLATLCIFCGISAAIIWFAVIAPISQQRKRERMEAVLKKELRILHELVSASSTGVACGGGTTALENSLQRSVRDKINCFGKNHLEIAVSWALVADFYNGPRRQTGIIHQRRFLRALLVAGEAFCEATKSCRKNGVSDCPNHHLLVDRQHFGGGMLLAGSFSQERRSLLVRVLGNLSPSLHEEILGLERVLLSIVELSQQKPREEETETAARLQLGGEAGFDADKEPTEESVANAAALSFTFLCALRHSSNGQLRGVVRGVDFSHVQLVGADFLGMTFQNCSFLNANLTDACVEKCTFSGCDFTGVTWSKLAPRDDDESEGERRSTINRRPTSTFCQPERRICHATFAATNSLVVADADHFVLQTCNLRGLDESISSNVGDEISWTTSLVAHRRPVVGLIVSPDRRLMMSMDPDTIWTWSNSGMDSAAPVVWERSQKIVPATGGGRFVSLFGFFHEGRSAIVFAALTETSFDQLSRKKNSEGIHLPPQHRIEFYVHRSRPRTASSAAVTCCWELNRTIYVASLDASLECLVIERVLVYAVACTVDGLSLYDRFGTLLQRLSPPLRQIHLRDQNLHRYARVHSAGRCFAVVDTSCVHFYGTSASSTLSQPSSNPLSRSATEDVFSFPAAPWPERQALAPPAHSRETSVVFLEDDRNAPSSPMASTSAAAPFSGLQLLGSAGWDHTREESLGCITASCSTLLSHFIVVCATPTHLTAIDAKKMVVLWTSPLHPLTAGLSFIPRLLCASGDQLALLTSDGVLQLRDLSRIEAGDDDDASSAMSLFLELKLPVCQPRILAVHDVGLTTEEDVVAAVAFENLPSVVFYFPSRHQSSSRRFDLHAALPPAVTEVVVVECFFVASFSSAILFMRSGHVLSIHDSLVVVNPKQPSVSAKTVLNSTSLVELCEQADEHIASCILSPDQSSCLVMFRSNSSQQLASVALLKFVTVNEHSSPWSLEIMWKRPHINPSQASSMRSCFFGFNGCSGGITKLASTQCNDDNSSALVVTDESCSACSESAAAVPREVIHLFPNESLVDVAFSPSGTHVALRSTRRVFVLQLQPISSLAITPCIEVPFICHSTQASSYHRCFAVLDSGNVILQEVDAHFAYLINPSCGDSAVRPIDMLKHVMLSPRGCSSQRVILATDKFAQVHAFFRAPSATMVEAETASQVFNNPTIFESFSRLFGEEAFVLMRDSLPSNSSTCKENKIVTWRRHRSFGRGKASPSPARPICSDRRPSSMFMSTTSSESVSSQQNPPPSFGRGFFFESSMPQGRFLMTIGAQAADLLVWDVDLGAARRRFSWGKRSRPIAASAIERDAVKLTAEQKLASFAGILFRIAILCSCATETASTISIYDVSERHDSLIYCMDTPMLLIAISFASKAAQRIFVWVDNAPFDIFVSDTIRGVDEVAAAEIDGGGDDNQKPPQLALTRRTNIVTVGSFDGPVIRQWQQVSVAGLCSDWPLMIYLDPARFSVFISPLHEDCYSQPTRLTCVRVPSDWSLPISLVTTSCHSPRVLLQGNVGQVVLLAPNCFDGDILMTPICSNALDRDKCSQETNTINPRWHADLVESDDLAAGLLIYNGEISMSLCYLDDSQQGSIIEAAASYFHPLTSRIRYMSCSWTLKRVAVVSEDSSVKFVACRFASKTTINVSLMARCASSDASSVPIVSRLHSYCNQCGTFVLVSTRFDEQHRATQIELSFVEAARSDRGEKELQGVPVSLPLMLTTSHQALEVTSLDLFNGLSCCLAPQDGGHCVALGTIRSYGTNQLLFELWRTTWRKQAATLDTSEIMFRRALPEYCHSVVATRVFSKMSGCDGAEGPGNITTCVICLVERVPPSASWTRSATDENSGEDPSAASAQQKVCRRFAIAIASCDSSEADCDDFSADWTVLPLRGDFSASSSRLSSITVNFDLQFACVMSEGATAVLDLRRCCLAEDGCGFLPPLRDCIFLPFRCQVLWSSGGCCLAAATNTSVEVWCVDQTIAPTAASRQASSSKLLCSADLTGLMEMASRMASANGSVCPVSMALCKLSNDFTGEPLVASFVVIVGTFVVVLGITVEPRVVMTNCMQIGNNISACFRLVSQASTIRLSRKGRNDNDDEETSLRSRFEVIDCDGTVLSLSLPLGGLMDNTKLICLARNETAGK